MSSDMSAKRWRRPFIEVARDRLARMRFHLRNVVSALNRSRLSTPTSLTYNLRTFLPLALSAFLAQDYPRKKLVVVDDGTDAVSDLLCGLECVRYIRLPARTTIGRKRNLACDADRGRIVAHWDDDDWHGSGRLRHQVRPLLAGEADVFGLEDSFELDLGAGEFWRTEPALHQRMFVGNVHGGTQVYWKGLFDEGIRYPDGNLAEDAGFLRQALKRGKRLAQLPNPGLFVYMRHGRNSWCFQPGRFLEPSGWERVCAPASFTADLLAAYCAAVTQGKAPCLAGMPARPPSTQSDSDRNTI